MKGAYPRQVVVVQCIDLHREIRVGNVGDIECDSIWCSPVIPDQNSSMAGAWGEASY